MELEHLERIRYCNEISDFHKDTINEQEDYFRDYK